MSAEHVEIPPFDRRFFEGDLSFSRIGTGEAGGKAGGLLSVATRLRADPVVSASTDLEVDLPRSVVIMTGVFDAFLRENDLEPAVLAGLDDDRIRHAFRAASIPATVIGDLRALVEGVDRPLAVRSSSRLEDQLGHPLAGVYSTKMTPNNQHDAGSRFQRLIEAIKTVYASTFFADARAYHAKIGVAPGEERMGVLIQEVVGDRHGSRFYPECSGVGRSHDFYPFSDARPEDGVVELALGLGKTIVDGDVVWRYSPAQPQAPPPFGSVEERVSGTQLSFWAVNMAPPPESLPLSEDEYLVRCSLDVAEADRTLGEVASTLVADSGRLVAGTGRDGARVVDFAPLLTTRGSGFNLAISRLLEIGRDAVGRDVEIEFAYTRGRAPDRPPRLVLLQVRPTLVRSESVRLTETDLHDPEALVATDRALGNGRTPGIRDVVYVRPDRFDALRAREIASELDRVNQCLVAEGRGYLLIAFGRWGSSDPSLGIPVTWGQISGAGCIVEATRPEMDVTFSQGSHFFHNITSFGVGYLMVRHRGDHLIDWPWLEARPAQHEGPYVRHVRLGDPLRIEIDGSTGRGLVSRVPDGDER